MTNRVSLRPAEGWKGLPANAEALEGKISIFLHGGAEQGLRHGGREVGRGGYDRLLVCKDKDASQAVATMGLGQWSEWVIDTFDLRPDEEKIKQREAERGQIKKYAIKEWPRQPGRTTSPGGRKEGLMACSKFGDEARGSFRFKLINLSADASQLELLLHADLADLRLHAAGRAGRGTAGERRALLHQPGPRRPALRVDRRAHLLRAVGLPAPVAGQGRQVPRRQ